MATCEVTGLFAHLVPPEEGGRDECEGGVVTVASMNLEKNVFVENREVEVYMEDATKPLFELIQRPHVAWNFA